MTQQDIFIKVIVQINDVLGIFQIQHENLDYDYIEKWVKELNIWDVWGKVKQKTPKESL